MPVIFTMRLSGKESTRVSSQGPAGPGFSLEGSSGNTVILIHGLTGTPNEMRFPATYLNRKGYNVIVPRLANHGEPLSVLKNTRWQEFYSSVRNAVIKSRAMEGPGEVFAAGLSMGALLALLLADEFSDRISGVSCLAPTLFYDGWNTPRARFFMPLACTPLKHFFYFKEEPPYCVKNETIRARIHRYYSRTSLDEAGDVAQYGYPFFPVTQLYQLQLLVRHISKRLARIETPVQLIQARHDDLTSVKNSEYIFNRIASSVKEMVLLNDSYHVVTVDQERGIVAEKMAEFFGRAGSASQQILREVYHDQAV